MSKTEDKKIKTSNGERTLRVFDYFSNGRLALMLYDAEGYQDDITVNLPFFPVDDIDYGIINGDINCINSKGENLVDTLKELGIIEESYGFYPYNHGSYEYVKFDMKKIKEYDKEGTEKYLNKYKLEEELDIKI